MVMMMAIRRRGLVVGDRAREGLCGCGEESVGMRSWSGPEGVERGVKSVSLRLCGSAGGCGGGGGVAVGRTS